MRYSYSRLILALAALMHATATAAMPSGDVICPGPPPVLRQLQAETCSRAACSATVFCCTCYSCTNGSLKFTYGFLACQRGNGGTFFKKTTAYIMHEQVEVLVLSRHHRRPSKLRGRRLLTFEQSKTSPSILPQQRALDRTSTAGAVHVLRLQPSCTRASPPPFRERKSSALPPRRPSERFNPRSAPEKCAPPPRTAARATPVKVVWLAHWDIFRNGPPQRFRYWEWCLRGKEGNNKAIPRWFPEVHILRCFEVFGSTVTIGSTPLGSAAHR
ncbi:hypothetical protein B0H13DRAFT_1912280 [Mycena leptocephala]|nr:hypothetical protein B0H13DRAFT_1912280 [Mycena leptocephala]